MKRNSSHVLGACWWLSALLAAGCASHPSQPSPLDPSVEPSFVRVPAARAVPFSATGPGSSTTSRTIDGSKGGSFSNGYFTLVVPPGAFAGKATLSILVPDPTELRCDLTISPPEANNFNVPVELMADCSTGIDVDPTKLATVWHDVGNNRWVLIPGSAVSRETVTIRTPLRHFSEYGILGGKAGW